MHDTTPLPSHEPRPKRAFVRDEEGGILVFWALFLAIAFGFVALTFDIGRVANTQSELQSFADQVALAAAGELDGRSSAIVRATDAADGLISRRQTFGDGGEEMRGQGEYTLTFLSSLPANDRDPATATTTDPTRARFVQVSVNQRNVQTPFAAINATLVGRAGANAQSQVGATAVAGNSGWACDITPLFMCAPSAEWKADDHVGEMIKIVSSGGGGGTWTPGNFGFINLSSLDIDPDGACKDEPNNAAKYRCLMAATGGASRCVPTEAGLWTRTGAISGLIDGINTRFDQYDSTDGTGRWARDRRDDDRFRPAPNIIQGRPLKVLGNEGGQSQNQIASCTWKQDTDIDPDEARIAMPRDTCIKNGTCTRFSDGSWRTRFGDGIWDRELYIERNHGGIWPGAVARPNITRFEMYNLELDEFGEGLTDAGSGGICHLNGFAGRERRTLIAAVADCSAGKPTGQSEPVVPIEFVRLFLTEPMVNNSEIFVEVIGSAGGGLGSGVIDSSFREVIQLHR